MKTLGVVMLKHPFHLLKACFVKSLIVGYPMELEKKLEGNYKYMELCWLMKTGWKGQPSCVEQWIGQTL